MRPRRSSWHVVGALVRPLLPCGSCARPRCKCPFLRTTVRTLTAPPSSALAHCSLPFLQHPPSDLRSSPTLTCWGGARSWSPTPTTSPWTRTWTCWYVCVRAHVHASGCLRACACDVNVGGRTGRERRGCSMAVLLPGGSGCADAAAPAAGACRGAHQALPSWATPCRPSQRPRRASVAPTFPTWSTWRRCMPRAQARPLSTCAGERCGKQLCAAAWCERKVRLQGS